MLPSDDVYKPTYNYKVKRKERSNETNYITYDITYILLHYIQCTQTHFTYYIYSYIVI